LTFEGIQDVEKSQEQNPNSQFLPGKSAAQNWN